MMIFQRKTGFIVLLVIVLLVITSFFFLRPSHPDALWKIVSQQCVPHQQQRQNPSPCAEVNLAQRFVVFKDRNGPLQYLLMPTAKVTGIESPLLLNPQQPNYFAAAWQQRDWLSTRYGKPVPDDLLSFTINSEYGRTQNQLHIHMSCTKPKVLARIASLAPSLSSQWQPVQIGINYHSYWARTLDRNSLGKNSPFILLAEGLPQARENMGAFGLALLPTAEGNFVLLATQREWWRLNLASIEEIQDHSCASLTPRVNNPQ
ncbi:CDP-diacylglycerol diphosphatase [Hafnia alvei]|nr:CDP-diacylglycerol diphosphatase [Hafnia alvei]